MGYVMKGIQKFIGRKSTEDIVREFATVISKLEGRAEVLKDEILEKEAAVKKATEEKAKSQAELERAHGCIERFEKLFFA